MRNLYKALSISENSTSSEIQAAIRRCQDSELRRDAEAAFGSDKRRMQYDVIYRQLIIIGHLRATLGLQNSGYWARSLKVDFQPTVVRRESRLRKFLTKTGFSRSFNDNSQYDKSVAPLIWIAVFVAIVMLLSIVSTGPSPPTSVSDPEMSDNQEVDDGPEQALPATGTVRTHSIQRSIAPFEIVTSSGANYFVKLVDVQAGVDVVDIFVRGGDRVEVTVPIGVYELRYATGSKWYGYESLFGRETTYNKADQHLQFRFDGNRIIGVTVTLYQVVDGNLRTSRISSSRF